MKRLYAILGCLCLWGSTAAWAQQAPVNSPEIPKPPALYQAGLRGVHPRPDEYWVHPMGTQGDAASKLLQRLQFERFMRHVLSGKTSGPELLVGPQGRLLTGPSDVPSP